MSFKDVQQSKPFILYPSCFIELYFCPPSVSVSPRRARTKSAIGDDGAEPPQNPISLSFGSSAVPALLHPPASFFPHSWRRPICTWACGRRMWLGWSGHDTGICKGVFIIVAWQSRSSSHRSVSWTELEKLLSSLSLSLALLLSPLPFFLSE